MVEKISKGDFIEIDYSAKVKDGELFDSTRKEDIEKTGSKAKPKPYLLAAGEDMLIKGFDKDLIGKEIGKEYSIEIKPEEAFGKRDPKQVRMVPLSAFKEQNVMPERGMQFQIDGQNVRIASVSGGRVLVDFNNPLAGKTVVYEYKINKKVTDQKEKIAALQDFFFRKEFEYSINKEKKELTIKTPEGFDKFAMLFAQKFEEILGLKLKTELAETSKELSHEKEKKEESSEDDKKKDSTTKS